MKKMKSRRTAKRELRLTRRLKNNIVALAHATKDLDAVEAATGVSYELLNKWILRGTRNKNAIYRELRDELKPVYSDMCWRNAMRLIGDFFLLLARMAENPRWLPILTLALYSGIVSDPRKDNQTRIKAARRIIDTFRPLIHPQRFRAVKEELGRIAKMQGRGTTAILINNALADIFLAIDRPPPDKDVADLWTQLKQAVGKYRKTRTVLNDSITESFDPGWRRKPREEEHFDVPDPDMLEQMVELKEHLWKLCELLPEKSPGEVLNAIQESKSITEFRSKLRMEHAKFYREVVGPARQSEDSPKKIL